MRKAHRRPAVVPPAGLVIIAHRGSSGDAPENTLAAFRRAVQAGADMIELDVRMTHDGFLVVIHDRRVVRMTGSKGRVGGLILSDLRQLDFGRRFGHEFTGEKIPTLVEVFRAVPTRVGINIEVKTDGDRVRIRAIAQELCRLLGTEPGGRRIIVSSFDHRFLRVFHAGCPGVPLGTLYMTVRDFGRSPSVLCHRTGASTFICSRSQIRLRAVQDAHRHGITVFVYGVERARQAAAMVRYGVDGVMTNHPARIRRALEQAQ
jgi:glycerophosphoryl diester phosphodiesterase